MDWRVQMSGDACIIRELFEHYRVGIFRCKWYRVGDLLAAEDFTSATSTDQVK